MSSLKNKAVNLLPVLLTEAELICREPDGFLLTQVKCSVTASLNYVCRALLLLPLLLQLLLFCLGLIHCQGRKSEGNNMMFGTVFKWYLHIFKAVYARASRGSSDWSSCSCYHQKLPLLLLTQPHSSAGFTLRCNQHIHSSSSSSSSSPTTLAIASLLTCNCCVVSGMSLLSSTPPPWFPKVCPRCCSSRSSRRPRSSGCRWSSCCPFRSTQHLQQPQATADAGPSGGGEPAVQC